MGLWEIIKGEQPGIIKTLLNYENAGQFGEFATEYALTNKNLDGELVVLKNIYVPTQGKTTEIDLLMIHEKGIFVFESKNYSGWIFGSADQLNWTQSLQNGDKNKFYNPIRQNRTHIKALAAFLEKPVSEFVSYIVFSERCTLKKVPADTSDVIIVRRPDMLKKLKATLKTTPTKYTFNDIQDIAKKLQPLTNKDDAEKQQHIINIQNKCPFCGGELTLRNGKYGRFWGCSNYPKCKFTRPEE
ncbi:MAG: NERD domain-containing protein [Eubacteriales bacterium]|nr:NERD domain-containing protein [Clostridium sp.]MDY5798796.1 NERD domain-containing protein [Eubacteriales bacterium]MCI6987555.1 NERD domain-containing protein [Clostridium sp.]MCI7012622.1 NERD domain-containing protein [Clostridium sp.]MDD5903673.1 NERD domain-containing protein [Clostridium sp.]